jgi:hypothetical protein
MKVINIHGDEPIQRAIQIVRAALDGDYDLLIACRDLTSLRRWLPGFAGDAMDIFAAVATEIDGFPIGAERELWAKEPLKLKDAVIADYRAVMTDLVRNALQEFLDTFDSVNRG